MKSDMKRMLPYPASMTHRLKNGICRELEGKPHLRMLILPVRAAKSHEPLYSCPTGCRILDIDTALIGGSPYARILIDITGDTDPEIPTMPKGWDYRDMLSSCR